MLIMNVVLFALSCGVLVKSSGLLVKSISKIAHHIGVNEFAIGFIVMALSTSLPELFVGITSAIAGRPELALGTIIGSNILDLTIVIGVVTLLARGVKIKSKIIKKDIVYMLGIVILPLLLAIDKKITRIDGAVLIAVFLLYMWQLTRQERRFKKKIDNVSKKESAFYSLLTIAGIFILLISSNYVVRFATILSLDLMFPPIFIGLFIVSLGTSLPELLFETKAVIAKHEDLAVGDLLGSVITNSTLVLGIIALIMPISVDLFLFFTSAIFLVLIAFIFMTFAESDKGITWKEGMALILLYVFFVVIESYIKFVAR